MADSEDKPGISRRLTTPFRWVWRQIVRLGRAYLEDLQYLPILRWAVPGVAVIVGLFWLPFDLMPLDRMREWVWEGDAQEFRNALWGISAVVGVLLAMVGILLNYVRTRAINKQALTAEGRLAAEEEGRKTERYVRAVELLGHKEVAVRLGALYSLERLAKDSPVDQPTIMETIAAYVREQAPWPDVRKNSKHAPSTTTEKPKVREDIAAAITIIGRRERSADGEGRIDLSNTNLAGLDFPDAQLEGINLSGANLAKARLEGADLQGAYLTGTNFQEAELRTADLKGAELIAANLHGARLDDSNLRGAELAVADLTSAHLSKTDLQECNLMQANLEEAHLSNANVRGANLSEVNLRRAGLWATNLQRANLWNADLQGADLSEANLEGCHLTNANLHECEDLTQDQLIDIVFLPKNAPNLPDGLTLPIEPHNLLDFGPKAREIIDLLSIKLQNR